MGTYDPRFVLTPTGIADRYEPLEWEQRPGGTRVPWAEAEAAAVAAGRRLPSIAELVSFLGALPSEGGWVPERGAVFWSASGSPFARATYVRAACIERGGRLVIVLLDKGERAQRWAVRSTQDFVLGRGARV